MVIALKTLIISVIVSFMINSCTAKPTRQPEQNYINPEKVSELVREKGAVVVDTMSYLECMDHRIPGSLCIALEEFEEKSTAALKDKKQPVIFYCESEECPRAGQTGEKAKRLGYEDIYVLEGGLSAWKKAAKEVESIKRIKRAPVASIKSHMIPRLMEEKQNLFILDIRTEDIFKKDHIKGAVNIPLYTLHKRFKEIPGNRPVLVVDENGRRSFLACCWLINNDAKDVIRLYGGMKHTEVRKWEKN